MGKVRSFALFHAKLLALTQHQHFDYHAWVLNGRSASGLVPFVAPHKTNFKHKIASIASEVDIDSDVASEVDTDSDIASEADIDSDIDSEVDVASNVDTTSNVDNTSEADTVSDVDVASESDMSAEPAVQKNCKKRKLTHQKSSKKEAAHTGAMRKKRRLNKLDELSELSPFQALRAIKTNYLDCMDKKQQRRLRRAQKKFLRLKVSRKEAGFMAILRELSEAGENSKDPEYAASTKELARYIYHSDNSLGYGTHFTGDELLVEIAQATRALETIEMLRCTVEGF